MIRLGYNAVGFAAAAADKNKEKATTPTKSTTVSVIIFELILEWMGDGGRVDLFPALDTQVMTYSRSNLNDSGFVIFRCTSNLPGLDDDGFTADSRKGRATLF